MATDSLASLRDIHLPQAISHWPLAPGWVLLFLVVLSLTGWLSYTFFLHKVQQRPKREALKLLNQIYQHHLEGKSLNQSCHDINVLLKRVALVYHPREQVANLHDAAWIQFLIRTSDNLEFNALQPFLIVYPYQNHTPKHEPQAIIPLVKTAQAWIKQQRRKK